jgi:GcrA cell cycle regulator
MWTQEETDLLAEHFKAGMSALESAIGLGERFGRGYTKNMVIGRRRRCGLVYGARAPEVSRVNSARALSRTIFSEAECAKRRALEVHRAAKREQSKNERLARQERTQTKKAQPASGWPYRQPVKPLVREQQRPASSRLTVVTRDAVMGLTAKSCRYPIGDIGDPSFKFCCEPRDVSSPYCAHHRSICVFNVAPRSQMLAPKV